ncbi:MAG: DUF3179 domain-containing (seleno)protein [Planctomycetota bacterium]
MNRLVRWGVLVTTAGAAGLLMTVALDAVHAANAAEREWQARNTPVMPTRPGTVRRPGSVNPLEVFDMSGFTLPQEEVHTLLPRDAIPALDEPETVALKDAAFLKPGDRLAVVEIRGESYAAPLRVLAYHEIINATLAGVPFAVTYCPLCDSVTAFERTVGEGDDRNELSFGVSGALHNSNVLMYDRQDRALWSQLRMEAVSGPRTGTRLTHLPARVVSPDRLRDRWPRARVATLNTGHDRDYDGPVYASYFADPDRLIVPVWGKGDALPPKTLGLGVIAGDDAWFITAQALRARAEDKPLTLETPMGPVRAIATDAGVEVIEQPEGVHTAQTFYYAWSAYRPQSVLVTGE